MAISRRHARPVVHRRQIPIRQRPIRRSLFPSQRRDLSRAQRHENSRPSSNLFSQRTSLGARRQRPSILGQSGQQREPFKCLHLTRAQREALTTPMSAFSSYQRRCRRHPLQSSLASWPVKSVGYRETNVVIYDVGAHIMNSTINILGLVIIFLLLVISLMSGQPMGRTN